MLERLIFVCSLCTLVIIQWLYRRMIATCGILLTRCWVDKSQDTATAGAHDMDDMRQSVLEKIVDEAAEMSKQRLLKHRFVIIHERKERWMCGLETRELCR